eukprot:EG_transcript_7743
MIHLVQTDDLEEACHLLFKEKKKETKGNRWRELQRLLATVGPGLVVMLADTDAGCLMTAGQSGATWGYALVTLQLLLVPVVFVTQELTVKLGIFTQQGQTELIRNTCGPVLGWVACIAILLTCAGGLVSEISGVVGVGELAGVPRWLSTLLFDAFLLALGLTGSYNRVERVAIGIGLFQLVFVVTMFMAQPKMSDVVDQMLHPPLQKEFLYLIAANFGAVIMPWMIFYQQSAVVERRLTVDDLKYSRIDTAVGACLTQLIMVATLATTAATAWDGHMPGRKQLNTVRDFSDTVTVHLGPVAGRILFSLGLLGGSLVGAIVVSLTATWSIGEMVGFKRSADGRLGDATWFYTAYSFVLLLGSLICLSPIDIIALNVFIQVLNAVLIPLVLGFLYYLSVTVLPEEDGLKGFQRWAIGTVFTVASLGSLFAVIVGVQA